MKTYWKLTYSLPKAEPFMKTAFIVADTEEAARESLENEFPGFTVDIKPGAVRMEMTDEEYENGE